MARRNGEWPSGTGNGPEGMGRKDPAEQGMARRDREGPGGAGNGPEEQGMTRLRIVEHSLARNSFYSSFLFGTMAFVQAGLAPFHSFASDSLTPIMSGTFNYCFHSGSIFHKGATPNLTRA
ncbi:hypothetical protein WISP_40630 [Willisornis vidua]|uniref:Uncharacterized protein n=1 Tax=Willisornis vidua TaxID=1566151 RepID=A0ABQ9DHP9_9PASS|nr:hypothetical protein WISP_40630 [Willisornis vidua]